MRPSSSTSTTAPVGLLGELRITPRTRPGIARSSAAAVGRQPSARCVGTNTGRAPVSRTISGNDTQYGEKSATSSPCSKSASHTLKTACFAPAVTMTFSRAIGAACSRWYLAAMASRSAASPATSVYLVRPASIARAPARPTNPGVGEVRLADREVDHVDARGGQGLGLLAGRRGRGRGEGRDPSGELQFRHRRCLQDRANAEKARIRFRPKATRASSSAIQAA